MAMGMINSHCDLFPPGGIKGLFIQSTVMVIWIGFFKNAIC